MLLSAAVGSVAGCERAWRNGFLDPTQVGRFDPQPVRNEIRRTLGPLEEPEGIPGAVEPTREDLVASYVEVPVSRGDILDVSIFELLQPGAATDVRRQVNDVGFITLPVLGPVKMAGMTPRELELQLINTLREKEILQKPEVSVTVVASQAKRFAVIGNVNRPGEYPIPRADFRLLDMMATIGPLSAAQKRLYIMRGGQPPAVTPPGAEEPFKPLPEPAESDPFAPSGPDALEPPALSDVSSGWPAPSGPSRAPWQAGEKPDGAPTGQAPAAQPQPLPARSPADELLAAPPEDDPLDEGITPSRAPTHNDFLDVLSPHPAEQPPDLIGLTTRPASQSQFIFRNGEWIEVTGAETQPTTPEDADALPTLPPEEGVPGLPPTTATRPDSVDWEALTEAETPLRIIEIPVDPLLKGDMRYNIVIRPNDVVNVPVGQFGEYYVTGHVARPGAYSLTGREITVKEAIASAGGFALLAWPSRCELIRRLAGDQEEIRSLNLDRIFAGEEPDFFLRPNDILNVGTTAVAPFLATIRNSFRMSYGFGFVYDRNFADEDTFFAREQIRNRRRAERIQRGFPP